MSKCSKMHMTINACQCACCQRKENKSSKKRVTLNADQRIRIAQMYLDEWKHRDNNYVFQLFSYFLFILATGTFPLYAKHYCIAIPDSFPKIVFPLIGLLLSFVFLMIAILFSKRLSTVGDKYRAIVKSLFNIRKEKEQKKKRHFVYCLSAFMFLCLITVNVLAFFLLL